MITLGDWGSSWAGWVFIAYAVVSNWHVLGWLWAQRLSDSQTPLVEQSELRRKDGHDDKH